MIVPHRAVSHAITCEVEDYLKHSSKKLSLASHSSDVVISDYFAGFAAKCTVFVMDWCKFSTNPESVIVENHIDTIHCTPTRLAAIDAEYLAKLEHKLEIILFGGNDTMPPSLLEKWLRLFPHTMFINCYGPTETTLQVSMKKFNFKDNLLNRTHVNLSIGKPFPGSAFYVVDPKVRGKKVQLMGPGQIGELYIGGLQVCSGYLNRANETSEFFVPDPYEWHNLSLKRSVISGKAFLFRTGDLVCWNTDGELEFRGKMENAFAQVKGRRVDLFVVKGIIERIPEIMMAALNLEHDEKGLDSVVAYVKLKIDSTLVEIIRECKRRLEPHETPYKFVRVEEFPTVGNGRIDFKKLSGNQSAIVAQDSKYSSPKLTHKEAAFPLQFLTPEVISQDERVIAKIILGKASIALNQPEISDFSDDVDLINVCGMNSITAAKLCSMIRNIYPTVEIDAHYIMQYCKTPAEIASRISSSMKDHTSTFFIDNTRFVSTSVNDSQSSIHSYTLTDQATLFYGVAFYSKYPAWLVNSFRRKFFHAVRIYEFIQFKPLKGDSLDAYYNRIDPIRLHNAMERLFEAHPVLCTRLVPLKKGGFSFFSGYSKTASLSMRTAPLLVPVETIVFSRLSDVRLKMEIAGVLNYDGNIVVAYSLEVFYIIINYRT